MSDKLDERLDELLRARRVPAASPDLAQRIILRAQQLPQDKSLPLWQWVRDLFAEFHLPQPAYVLAGVLLLGMLIGFNAPDQQDGTIDGSSTVQIVFGVDEGLL
jgi:hypothetical protein